MLKNILLCFLLTSCERLFKREMGIVDQWSEEHFQEMLQDGYKLLPKDTIATMLEMPQQRDSYRCGLFALYRSMQTFTSLFQENIIEDLSWAYDEYCFVPGFVGCTPSSLSDDA